VEQRAHEGAAQKRDDRGGHRVADAAVPHLVGSHWEGFRETLQASALTGREVAWVPLCWSHARARQRRSRVSSSSSISG
jgi:hypothetical protein